MKIIDNTSLLLGDDLKATLARGARLKIAACCFSIYAFEALKAELSKVESLQFIFTAPTFVPTEVTDRLRKERREFFIPKTTRERGLYGTEFEIQLRNKLTQRAVAAAQNEVRSLAADPVHDEVPVVEEERPLPAQMRVGEDHHPVV